MIMCTLADGPPVEMSGACKLPMQLRGSGCLPVRVVRYEGNSKGGERTNSTRNHGGKCFWESTGLTNDWWGSTFLKSHLDPPLHSPCRRSEAIMKGQHNRAHIEIAMHGRSWAKQTVDKPRQEGGGGGGGVPC